MNVSQLMNQPEQKTGNSFRRMLSSILLIAVLFVGASESSRADQQTKPQAQQTVQSVVAKQAALVSEFDVNGLKVLLKKREGSLTVAAGLFIRGGSANINAQNAGIETLMLSAATEASTNFPREKMRSELARMGTVIGSSSNNDYSVLSLATTRMHFDRSWQIFADVALHPSFTKEDVALVQQREHPVIAWRAVSTDPGPCARRTTRVRGAIGRPLSEALRGHDDNTVIDREVMDR